MKILVIYVDNLPAPLNSVQFENHIFDVPDWLSPEECMTNIDIQLQSHWLWNIKVINYININQVFSK